MTPATTSAFDLPSHLAHKAAPELVADDETHFAAIAASLERQVRTLEHRLDEARRARGGGGQQALERDQEIHRLTADLRVLRRFGLDVVLGRVVPEAGDPLWIGRLGLTDADGHRLLVDWRAPAAEPFFAATHRDPMGLASRRRYRWDAGRVADYWDEAFTEEGLGSGAALDDQSAFIASLGDTRSGRMRDVLSTIQSDQDAIIRAGSRGALVVDGGPGTGKTVVALHRAAYLLYSDSRLGDRHGGVLLVGPHRPYLAYVADVLPGLGEEGVRTCTVTDLLPEGSSADPEGDAHVAELKSSARMIEAIEPAVRLYEEPPSETVVVETDWADVAIDTGDWAEAFAAPEPGLPHNEAREQVHDALVDESGLPTPDPDQLAGPFAHVIVDEAQELTDAQWQMLLARCPSRSFTVVGDRAQARHGFAESWAERLERIGLDRHELATLSINYRTPQEVMAEAEPVIRAVLPDANVPTSVRSNGLAVQHGSREDLPSVLTEWLASHEEGIACVIGDPSVEDGVRVRSLSPEHAKGLEFDLVVLVDPDELPEGTEAAVDRYVAMTRATQQLVVLRH